MKKYSIILLAILMVACSKKSEEVNTPPTVSNYIAPPNNKTCVGEAMSNSDKIQVRFEWEPFKDAQDATLTYSVRVTQKLYMSDIGRKEVNTNSVTFELKRGYEYLWEVTATDRKGESVTGPSWTFQTPAYMNDNHLPYPATLVSPTNGQTVTANQSIPLKWEGSDPDDGETSKLRYDIYLGKTHNPEKIKEGHPSTTYYVSLSKGVYYWKVVSRDPRNGASSSQLYQLNVE